MNARQWMAAALAALLVSGGTSAAAHERGFDRAGPPRGERAYGPGGNRHFGPPAHHHRDYRQGHYRSAPQRYGPPPQRYGHGYPGARAGFHPGARLPRGYRQQYYVVDQWRGYPRLSPPPRGHHWVQRGSDFALVAIATGVIAAVILAND